MLRLSLVIQLLVTILSASILAATPPALESLRAQMKSVTSFEVEFDQEILQELFPDSPTKASGRLMFTRPNRLNWTYESPKKRVIAFDGKELRIQEGTETQIIHDRGRITLEKSFSFLWGQPDSEVFSIKSLDKERFRIVPKNKDDVNFESMDVQVLKGRVSQVVVSDRIGGQSKLLFKNWQLK